MTPEDRSRFDAAVAKLYSAIDRNPEVWGCALARCRGPEQLQPPDPAWGDTGKPYYSGILAGPEGVIAVGIAMGFTEEESYDIASGWDFGPYSPSAFTWHDFGRTTSKDTEARALGSKLYREILVEGNVDQA